MIVEIVSIELTLEKVHYYSVILGDNLISEFRDFQIRLAIAPNTRELSEINEYIYKIGEKYGANEAHFKRENAAERLPPPYHRFIDSEEVNDFGLRLYCIRLSPSVVILLNGDRKTSLKIKDCKNCYRHFEKANRIATKINQAIIEGFIEIDEDNKEILIEEDFDLII